MITDQVPVDDVQVVEDAANGGRFFGHLVANVLVKANKYAHRVDPINQSVGIFIIGVIFKKTKQHTCTSRHADSIPYGRSRA